MRKPQAEIKAKAVQVWQSMTDSEKHGVRFGMFPAEKMQAVESEGFGQSLRRLRAYGLRHERRWDARLTARKPSNT
jgi:hypothetical protein